MLLASFKLHVLCKMSNSFCQLLQLRRHYVHYTGIPVGYHKQRRLNLKITCESILNVSSVVKANVTNKSLQKFEFKGYNLFCKNRQVASGILVEIKTTLITRFKVLKHTR